MILNDYPIKGRYKAVKKIGQGAFGEIYIASDVRINENVAVKIEKIDAKRNVLRAEVNILRKLQGCSHFCRFYQCGTDKFEDVEFNFLVMELLGDSLAELRKRQPENRFSFHTTARLGTQMLHCIEEIHESGYLHRDIKPSNFAMGLGPDKEYRCYMIDFGLARRYLMPTGETRPPRDNAGFRGTARYASVYSHQSKELGRRDDLWSFLYLIVEFMVGYLPWRRLKEKDAIGRMKVEYLDGVQLLASLPDEIKEIHEHISSLGYGDKPNYQQLHFLLHQLYYRGGPSTSVLYDWMLPATSLNGTVPPAQSSTNLVLPTSKGKKMTEASARSRPRRNLQEDINTMTENLAIQTHTVDAEEGPTPAPYTNTRNASFRAAGGDPSDDEQAGESTTSLSRSLAKSELFAPMQTCLRTSQADRGASGRTTSGALEPFDRDRRGQSRHELYSERDRTEWELERNQNAAVARQLARLAVADDLESSRLLDSRLDRTATEVRPNPLPLLPYVADLRQHAQPVPALAPPPPYNMSSTPDSAVVTPAAVHLNMINRASDDRADPSPAPSPHCQAVPQPPQHTADTGGPNDAGSGAIPHALSPSPLTRHSLADAEGGGLAKSKKGKSNKKSSRSASSSALNTAPSPPPRTGSKQHRTKKNCAIM